jgi:hypothetical protein
MKILLRFLLLITLILFIISCYKITESEPITTSSKIIYRHHEDKKTEYGYYYGYSMMKGKYCYHYGLHEISEENTVKFVFLGDTLYRDSKFLFNKSSDSLEIIYTKVFYVKKNEELKFSHNNIIDMK